MEAGKRCFDEHVLEEINRKIYVRRVVWREQ